MSKLPNWLAGLLKREETELHHLLVAGAVVAAFAVGLGAGLRNGVVFSQTAGLAQGPDVSRWQNYLPCSFWSNTAIGLSKAGGADGGEYQDPQFTHNLACMRQYVPNHGTYFFASPPAADPGDGYATEKSWGAQQAGYYASLINANGGLRTGEAVMLDLETGSGDQSAFAASFLSTLQTKLGVAPLLYASLGYIYTDLGNRGADGLSRYPLDLADWYYGTPPAPPAPWTSLSLWQWTSAGSWNGVAPVDLNYQVHAWPGKQAPPPPPPAPVSITDWHDAAGNYALNGDGAIKALNGAPAVVGTPSWPSWDIARGIAFPEAGGGLILDGWGGVHAFGGAQATGFSYWPGWDIARSLALGKDGGYTMDAWGGLHPFCVGSSCAPAATGGPYWPGWYIARDVAMVPGTDEGYVLDGWGGVHGFNGAPAVTISGYWKGWDIARSIAVNPDGRSGYVLDGWGGIHPFMIQVPDVASTPAPAVCGAAYWPAWDVARDLVLTGSATGYVLDVFGNVHPFKPC